MSLFGPGADAKGIVLGVSGGPDSIALMGLIAKWRDGLWEQGSHRAPDLFVATVNHGLRKEARQEAALVARLADALGLRHAILEWSGSNPSAGLPAAARAARYGLLIAHAKGLGASHIATAHTLDDQAETVLMRMAAGSGPAGLAGMRAFSPRGGITHWRPLLAVPKARLIATCARNGWPHVDDPTNADPRFSRSRWRSLMPELAREGLNAARLGMLAARQARVDDALDAQAKASLGPAAALAGGAAFARHRLADAPEEIVVRALILAIRLCGNMANDSAVGEQAHLRLERIERLAARVHLALKAGETLKASISGLVLSLDRAGVIMLRQEGQRRRGRTGPCSGNSLVPPRQ